MSTEAELREGIAKHGETLSRLGFTPGTSGNISVKLDDGFLVTPTNSSMGRLDPSRISKIDSDGRHVAGDPPSKEGPFHLAVYGERPESGAVVHLHSHYSVALSCLADVEPTNVLPPLTPYFVARIGRLPLVPYAPPGSRELAEAVALAAKDHHAMLLANHGPIVAGKSLDDAVYASEELEATAKLYLTLKGRELRALTESQVEQIERELQR